MNNLKTILLLALLLFPGIHINSQSYHKFIEDETKYWDLASLNAANTCLFTNFPTRFCIAEDTVIADNLYMKVFSYKFMGTHSNNGYCPPYQIDTVRQKTSFYIREDTISKKVFRYFPEEKKDSLIFDFSLSIGDTLYNPKSYSNSIIIDSITTIVTKDNINRRIFYFSDTAITYSMGSIIEGIGGSDGPFEFPFETLFSFEPQLICVTVDNVNVYGDWCYDFIAGVNP